MDSDDDNKSWKGIHISQLQTSLNRHQFPKLIPTDTHTILVKLPITVGCIPECYPPLFRKIDFWDSTHVKLPCSYKNDTKEQINRWDVMRNSFHSRISTSQELEAAILSYNQRYLERWNFSSLHSFFENIDEVESCYFFDKLLPNIVELALCLPQLITNGIPLLKHGLKHSITLSQLQISCLLANAFLCTYPHRNWAGKNSEYSDYPDINFNRLYQCEDPSRVASVHEKLKCILNYFRRVTTSVPTGVVTYNRAVVSNNAYPKWSTSTTKLPKLYVSCSGTIEDDGFGLFQIDFANKFVGGGVINTGCVQEEIRFVLCPELILSRLFTQGLSENEALVVTGCERFNKYKGYGWSFEWDGDYVDATPSDEYSRKYCTVIALDAVCYKQNPIEQYSLENIYRDLNKAYVGFSWGSRRKIEELCAVATGNWGCGVFGGDPQLKSLLQLMAAAEVGRDLAYFTFGDTELKDSMASIHHFLTDNNVTIGRIWKILELYNAKKLYLNTTLYNYIRNEATKNDVEDPETDDHPSLPKLFKLFSSSKVAVKKRSFCYSTKSAEQESQSGDAINTVKNSYEENLKRNELQSLTSFYGTPKLKEKPMGNSSIIDSFESFNSLKKAFKLRSGVQKKVSNKEVTDYALDLDGTDKMSHEVVSESIQQLIISPKNTNIQKHLKVVEHDSEKNSAELISRDDHKSEDEISEENEEDGIIHSGISKNKAYTNSDPIILSAPISDDVTSEIEEQYASTKPNICQTSQIFLTSRINKHSRKRKISDYFNPINKKPNRVLLKNVCNL